MAWKKAFSAVEYQVNMIFFAKVSYLSGPGKNVWKLNSVSILLL